MDSTKIARYLAGACSQAEKEKIEKWIEAGPANRKLMSEYRDIWEASESESEAVESMFNAEQDWERLQQRLMPHSGDAAASTFQQNNYTLHHSHSRMSPILKVAAVILLAALLGVVSYQNFYSPPVAETVEPTLREIVTPKGQLANIKLTDGTRVQLNADSKLRLPNVFQSDRREVFLEGEAFFDVAKNPDKPFFIHSGEAVVKILGTSLGVRSYPEDASVRVIVKEGRVSLQSTKKTGISREAILSPSEVGILDVSKSEIVTHSVQDMELYLSWTEGFLKFKNTPMRQVAQELERKYDIDVELKNDRIKELRLTAVLKSRSIRNVLDVIATSLDIDYELNQQQIIFREK